MTAEANQKAGPSGFEGAVAGFTLPDVIQLKGLNRFSGSLVVEFGRQEGVIFFRDGEIIHAEQGGKAGEAAFYEILRWPGGKFHFQPKVTTTSSTIKQGIQYLLLEAHRLMDEQQASRPARVAPTTEPTVVQKGDRPMSDIAARLMAIPGVAYAVLLGKDGAPVGDGSFEAEVLAAQGVYLGLTGNQLGRLFDLGDTRSAAVHGKNHHLLVFEAKQHYLSVAVNSDCQLGGVEAEIRTALAPKK